MARYIDADKLIEEMKKEDALIEYDDIEAYAEENTEDVAPVVHAEWMPCLNKCLETTHYVCSKCKGSSFKRNKTKYCHNCGAKMMEE